MRNPLYTMLIAVFFYSITNCILETKLAKYNTSVVVAGFYITMAILSIFHVAYTVKTSTEKIEFPDTIVLLLWFFLGSLSYYCAAVYDVQAYHDKGKTEILAMVFMVMPTFSMILMMFVKGRFPTWQELVGYGIIATGVVGGIIWLTKMTNIFTEQAS